MNTQTQNFVDYSGTITLGGAAQTIQVVNFHRKYLFICNPAASGGDSLHVKLGGTAVIGSGIPLYPGGSMTIEGNFCASNLISIIGPTTAQKFTCYLVDYP